MSDRKPLILIVEDDEDMARLNTRLLKRQGYDALVAFSAAEARKLFLEQKPDLYVLDVMLPDGDGLSLCQEIRSKHDEPVLFLTGKAETSDVIDGLDSGGDYYLAKPYDRKEFIAVVKSLLRRKQQTQKKLEEAYIIERGPLTLRVPERIAYVNGKNAELTPKEFAVLLILVQNENREVSYDHMYQKVWGDAMNNDVNALRQHISRMRKKIGEENTDAFNIFTEHGKGYTFTTLPQPENRPRD